MHTLLNTEPNLDLTSLFTIENGSLYTTSRVISEHFGKRHKNVLRRIKNLQADIDDAAIAEVYFQPQNYTDSCGKTQPEYRLTKDGFTLVVMGFTGSETQAYKISLIKAFNKLKVETTSALTPPMDRETIKFELNKKGYSLAMIADALGCSPVTVYAVIKRSHHSYRVANAIAAALELPIASVFPDVPSYMDRKHFSNTRKERVEALAKRLTH